MAKLEGRNGSGPTWFSISPVPAAQEGEDATEYVVQVWPVNSDGDTLTRRFSVAGWQMQHDDVWVLARAFAETLALLDIVIPISLWRTGRGEQAVLVESATWIDVTLRGNKRQQRVSVSYNVQEDAHLNLFRRFFLLTDVRQTARFGIELEQEIIEASPRWWAERNGS